jgi:sulfur-oxidizing protein SoxY
MKLQRRKFLRLGAAALGGFATAAFWPLRAMASAFDAAFKAPDMNGLFKELGATPTPSDQIQFASPDIAENGAVVPVSITSKLPKTEQIMVLVEKNPNPMAAVFMIPEGTEGFVSTRVKVGQTCNLYAVVKADGKLYSAVRETKVTLGGCGG